MVLLTRTARLQNIFERHKNDTLTPIARLTCGGMAGITSVTFTYPLDIVRTRLSIQSASFAELGEKPKKLPGMWQTMVTMYKTEGGFTALYRGIIPTVAGVAPYVGEPHGASWPLGDHSADPGHRSASIS